MRAKPENTKKLTLMAMLFALALVLSIAENAIPPIAGLLPGIKFGLSNVVVMYALFCMGKGFAFCIAGLKALFALMTRGLMAAALSLCGGVCSVLIMIFMLILFKDKISYIAISICGSVAHNMAQLALALFIVGAGITVFYLPVLLLSGIIMGVITGTTLKVAMPYFEKLKN